MAPSFLKRVPPIVLFVGVAFCWGMNTVAMKVAGRYVPPLTIAAARSLVGGILLLTIARRRHSDWPQGRAEWRPIVALAIVMTGLTTAALFLAAKNAPAGIVSIFTNTMPLWTAIMAPVFLSEKLRSGVLVGLAVGLCGTVLVAWRAVDGEIKVQGVVFGLVAALMSAGGSILYKKYPLPRLDRTMVIGVQLSISTVVLAALAIPDDRSDMQLRWQLVLSFVYLAFIGLAVSFVMFSELVSRATAMQSSAVAYLATVFGVVLGALMLHERLSLLVLVGGVVTIVGVAIVQFGEQLRSRFVD